MGLMQVLRRKQVIAHSLYQKSKRISIFVSMLDEIKTDEIIKDIFHHGKTCFIPRYQFQSNHMDMVKLASPEEIVHFPKHPGIFISPVRMRFGRRPCQQVTWTSSSCQVSGSMSKATGGGRPGLL